MFLGSKVGDKIKAVDLQSRLAFYNSSTDDIGDYAQRKITANNTDKARSNNSILSTSASIDIPEFLKGEGDSTSVSDVINYINLLARTVALRKFDFRRAGNCGSTYSRVSRWEDVNINTNADVDTGSLAKGAKISKSKLEEINRGIRDSIDAGTRDLAITFTYCHCNSHPQCHCSRGRR